MGFYGTWTDDFCMLLNLNGLMADIAW